MITLLVPLTIFVMVCLSEGELWWCIISDKMSPR
jgi:hypothetical protein